MGRGVVIAPVYLLCILWLLCIEQVQGSNLLPASDWDYVTFKLMVGREEFGEVRTICVDDSVFASLPDILSALGYGFVLRGDTLQRDSVCTVLPSGQYIVADDGLYLLHSAFSTLCSFQLKIYFQGFRIRIDAADDCPKLRLRRQEEQRNRLFAQREDLLLQRVDTLQLSLGRISSLGYSLSVNTTNQGVSGYNGVLSTNGELLKGALHLNYNRAKASDYQDNQLTFKLDYSFRSKLLKQLSLYRNYNTLTMDLGRYTNGIYLSNDNATFFNQRYYLYQGQTRPRANVEIYNNQVLVAYLSADSLGRYAVNIPVTAGSNTLTVLTMNDYGESLSEQKNIYMPLYLQPKGKFQYSFTSGYADSDKLFGGLYTAYGLTNKLTATAMIETVFGRRRFTSMAGIGAKYVPSTWLQLAVDYLPEVRYSLNVTGSASSYLGYSLLYEQYAKNQQKIANAPLQTMQLYVSGSVLLPKLRNTLTLALMQMEYPNYQSYTSSLRLNLYHGSWSGSAFVTGTSQKNFYPKRLSFGGSVGCRINERMYNDFSYNHVVAGAGNLFRERLQYRLAKRFSATVEIQCQTQEKQLSFQLGFNYRLPFATIGSNLRTTSNNWSMNNSISGGINLYGKGSVHFSDQVQAGATLRVVLFVDRNGNGKYDRGETVVEHPKVKLRTSCEQRQSRFGTYFGNIPPNRAFRLLVPRQVLRDISWQIQPVDTAFCLHTYQAHTVYFPVRVISSVSGELFSLVEGKRKRCPLRNVLIGITPVGGGPVFRTRTDEWGGYEYVGLTVGTYRVTVLSPGVKMKGKKEHSLVIPESDEGEQVEGIDFEVE